MYEAKYVKQDTCTYICVILYLWGNVPPCKEKFGKFFDHLEVTVIDGIDGKKSPPLRRTPPFGGSFQGGPPKSPEKGDFGGGGQMAHRHSHMGGMREVYYRIALGRNQ